MPGRGLLGGHDRTVLRGAVAGVAFFVEFDSTPAPWRSACPGREGLRSFAAPSPPFARPCDTAAPPRSVTCPSVTGRMEEAPTGEFFNSCGWPCGPRPGREIGHAYLLAPAPLHPPALFSDQAGALSEPVS